MTTTNITTAGTADRRVYLDNNATTPLDESVLLGMIEGLHVFGNPSSLHRQGREARAALDEARGRVATLIGASPREVVFAASGSESDNLAILGAVPAGPCPRVHVITSQVEHAAVLKSCRFLESLGHEVSYLPVDGAGRVDPWDVYLNVRSNTRLISIMHVNNETGTIQPIREVGDIAREAGVLFHTDACQSVGKEVLNVSELNADLVTFSAHKIYGPKGVAALYVRDGVTLRPLVHGGGQESGLRAGTENVLGAIGMGLACALARDAPGDEPARLRRLRDRLARGVAELGDVRVHTDLDVSTPGTLSVSVRHIKGDALAEALSLQGVAVSTGSACHAGEGRPSHVLVAMGIGEEWLPGALRFSLGRTTTEADIDYALDVLPRVVSRLRSMSPLALARPVRTCAEVPTPPADPPVVALLTSPVYPIA